MDTTLFLASIWGPIVFAVGLGILASRRYYTKIYRDLEKAPLALLTFGVAAMAAGIAQILAHNVWGSFTEGLVSFLGWATLAKGLLFIVAPGFVDRAGDWEAKSGFVSVAGIGCLVLGAYLSRVAYFA